MKNHLYILMLTLIVSITAISNVSAKEKKEVEVTPTNTVTLTIESWRSDDVGIWEEKIIPAFEKRHPNIKIKFAAEATKQYDKKLNGRLEAGTAGDIITCRPFDSSLKLYKEGHLLSLRKFKGMKNFPDVAKSGWVTDNGKHPYCMPMASVMHGFFYNGDIFAKKGYLIPKTHDEFFDLLDKLKADGEYIPMSWGVKDLWPATDMAFNNIGPNYWKGEEGRKALIKGDQKLTDEQWIAPYRHLEKWGEYLGPNALNTSYPESQALFTSGQAAIYPTGSWEITKFSKEAKFKMGVFLPPVPKNGDKCYVSDHIDIGMGINKASPHVEEVKVFLKWASQAQFAEIYANALPGFFPLSKVDIDIEDPYAREFISWRKQCDTTIRATRKIFSRGTPGLEIETREAVLSILKGKETPEQVAVRLQKSLSSWYKPQR